MCLALTVPMVRQEFGFPLQKGGVTGQSLRSKAHLPEPRCLGLLHGFTLRGSRTCKVSEKAYHLFLPTNHPSVSRCSLMPGVISSCCLSIPNCSIQMRELSTRNSCSQCWVSRTGSFRASTGTPETARGLWDFYGSPSNQRLFSLCPSSLTYRQQPAPTRAGREQDTYPRSSARCPPPSLLHRGDFWVADSNLGDICSPSGMPVIRSSQAASLLLWIGKEMWVFLLLPWLGELLGRASG